MIFYVLRWVCTYISANSLGNSVAESTGQHLNVHEHPGKTPNFAKALTVISLFC